MSEAAENCANFSTKKIADGGTKYPLGKGSECRSCNLAWNHRID